MVKRNFDMMKFGFAIFLLASLYSFDRMVKSCLDSPWLTKHQPCNAKHTAKTNLRPPATIR